MTLSIPYILKATGVTLKDPHLLCLALTHASKNRDSNNQRLEFLGDRVLGLVLADILYETYPDENEGALALRHAALVRAECLATIAKSYNLSDDIIVSGSDRQVGTSHIDNVLADTLEALIGALYLDQGYPTCRAFIQTLWAQTLTEMVRPPQDPKNTLQEWAQARALPLPVYEETNRTGPDHSPLFTITVTVKPDLKGIGSGPSRRAAEKQAALNLLTQLDLQKNV